MTLRAVFLGTPEAAVPSLAALRTVAEVALVITRPDAPAGRGRRPQPSAVKAAALEMGLDLAQPTQKSELATLVSDADVAVVVAFGMIIPPDALASPRRGFVNVHFSLLPRWRGAAPVERAIMAGDTETGVTIMAMDEGLDTGPVISHRTVPIGPTTTGGELRRQLSEEGAALLAETLPDWVEGRLAARPQPEEGATYAHRITAEDRDLSPSMSTQEAFNRIRALAPAPGARLSIEGVAHKILAVRPSNLDLEPGIWASSDGTPVVGMADGSLEVIEIQPPGKKAMSGAAWLRGRRLPRPS